MDGQKKVTTYLSVCPFIYLSVYLYELFSSSFSLSLSLSLSMHPFGLLSLYPCVHLSPSLHQSIHPSVRPNLSRPPCYRAILILLLFLGIVNTAGSVPSTGCVLLGTVGWRATLNTNTPPPPPERTTEIQGSHTRL